VSDEARPENFAVAREAALTWCQRSVMSTNGQLNLSPSLARTLFADQTDHPSPH
jgi:hypothetical protein